MPSSIRNLGETLSRRDFVVAGTSVTAGALVAPSAKNQIERLVTSASNQNARIQNVSLETGELEPEGRLEVYVWVKNTGQETLDSLWIQLNIDPPQDKGKTVSPDSNSVSTIDPGERTLEKLSFTLPENPILGKYSLSVWAYDASGYMYDQSGWDTKFNVRTNVQEFIQDTSTILWAGVKGAALGEWGSNHGVKHHDSFPYFAGWLTASIAEPIDVIADARDCGVLNRDWGTNTLDCGGFLLSAVGSAGVIVGAVATIIPEQLSSAAGIGIISISLPIDNSEDVADLARISETYVNQGGSFDEVRNFLISKYDEETLRKVADRLPARLATKLEDGLKAYTYKPPKIDREVVLTMSQYKRKFNKPGHLRKWSDIQKTLEQPTEIWKSDNGQIYWFIKNTDVPDEIMWIRATDYGKLSDAPGSKIRARTGYHANYDDIPKKADDMNQIYPR